MEPRISSLFWVLVLLGTSVRQSAQNLHDNQVDEDSSPFAEMASAFLQNNGGANVGGMLNNLMQSEGGKQLGGMLMDGLANNGVGTNEILSGLGSMLGNVQGGGGAGGGGLDAEMLGNVLSMFADSAGSSSSSSDQDRAGYKASGADPGEPSVGSVIGDLASNLFASQNGEKFMSYLPMILQTVSSFSGDDVKEHAREHSGHAWILPPIMEKLHVFWDHFVHSDLGKTLYLHLGVARIAKKFSDEQGNFDFDRVVSLLENHSFRRHWIGLATNYLADTVAHIADPVVQKKYFMNVQFLLNAFLKSQGYPKHSLFDPARPVETLTNLFNTVAKKYFNMKINAAPYVKPSVHYVQDILQMAQTQGKFIKRGIDTREISNKITDTLNLELIEPVLRVFRAYRYAKKVPQCDKYVMCLINQEDPGAKLSLPSIKFLLSRSCSVFASWFLSTHTNSPFWTLYTAVMEDSNCQAKYPVDCSDFHAEEVKVTTEYVHTEL